MLTRKLGNEGLEVSALGLGTMMMPDNEESVDTIRGSLELGVTLFDTADLYGEEYLLGRFGGNEKLLGRALKGRRDKAAIATKFGVTHTHKNLEVVSLIEAMAVQKGCTTSQFAQIENISPKGAAAGGRFPSQN
ncbi:aldo/keto reductase [Paenibacillus sp. sgz500992]|uniref:aldo/keto reductase n=1 Tax=Paenibacillus sp. sgz500992 TaxID=3242476 RepID=UPI0036D235DC